MPQAEPQFGPGGPAIGSGSGEASSPSATPPAGALIVSGAGAEGAAPPMVGGNGGDSAPSVLPTSAGVSAGITAWQNNKRVTGLWSINQNRNSWVFIDGVGWRKLANNSDSAIVSLTMLGSHAREKNSVVNYREEADGMVYEMYVW
jgi:hypothetical protein